MKSIARHRPCDAQHRCAMSESEKHVALFLPALGSGGIGRVMLNVAAGLVGRGIHVDLIVASAEGPYLTSVPRGIHLVDFKSKMTVTSLPKLVRYLRRDRPDALIAASNAVIPALIATKFLVSGIRVLARQDNTFSQQVKTANFKSRIALRLIRHLLPSADAVIAVSHGVAEDLKRRVPKAGHLVEVVPNPVVSEEITRQAEAPVDHPWFAESQVPVLLSVGRLVPQKDFPLLLKAFAEVAHHRKVRLVILGEGAEKGQLSKLASELRIAHIVDFPGFVANPFSYMSKSKAFVLPSRYEGFGNVLPEAMACGTPVVSTDCPYGPREILQDGKWGRLVPVGDSHALARAILETLDSPVPAHHLTSRAFDCSVQSSIDRHIEILN